MTGQELTALTNYPQEREIIFSADVKTDTTTIQQDINILNLKKADIDKENTFSAVQVFSSGVKTIPQTVTATTFAITGSHRFINLDTTSNAIACTLPEASEAIGQKLTLFFGVQGGSNLATLKSASGDFFDSANSNNTVTFSTVDSFIDIIAVSANRWLILTNSGCSLSAT